MEILSFKVFKFSYKQNTNLFSAYSYFNDALDYYNDDDNDIRDDDCYKIFIAEHLFRYSVLYSVLGFFATTLLEVKKTYSFVPDDETCVIFALFISCT